MPASSPDRVPGLEIQGAPSGFDGRSIPALRTDVLVVGAGIAGASAALRAAELGASVLCLAKTPLDQANTAWAKGGIAAVLAEEDSLDLHVRDTLRVGAGLSSAEVTDAIVAGGPETYDWLVRLGARFDHGEDGQLALGREGGHSKHRIVHAGGDATGLEIERALATALQREPKISCRFDTFVEDLLVVDGRCVGALVHDSSGPLAIHARSVVLAAGGSGQVYRETTNPAGATGDGHALALRAGAVLADMEFVQFHPTVLYIAGASRFLISEVVRGAGARLIDRHGVPFMEERHKDADLAPRDVVSRAILDRMVETNDTNVYLDLSKVDGDPVERFPSIARICDTFDLDLHRDPIPVRPGAHYMIGGVRTDLSGRTNVEGLFAVGEVAATGLHGANRLASNSLLEGAVVGLRAGDAAADAKDYDGPVRCDRSEPRPVMPPEAAGLHLDDVLYSLKSLMWRQVGVKREAEGLEMATDRIALWHRYVTRSSKGRRRDRELLNMLTVSALVAASALTRTESRGTHHREDHLDRDDDGWMCRVLMRRLEDGSVAIDRESLDGATDDLA